jgi:hypothetical protein
VGRDELGIVLRPCGKARQNIAGNWPPCRCRVIAGDLHVKIRCIVLALCGLLLCSPVQAKTFVGVLWPMFGPLPAIGLVELVGEIKMMQDVEVTTYLHQEWPQLIEDLEKLPKGTHTIIVGYSLGANATTFVANKTYVDLIIALQPSMLSWNPPITGKVGRIIEVYNPNPWMTFGGMGSKKLIGPNIEYVENNDSHPGAQFNGDFRALVKAEIAKMVALGDTTVAQANPPQPPQAPKPNKPDPITAELAKPRTKDATTIPELLSYAEPGQADAARSAKSAKPSVKPDAVAKAQPKLQLQPKDQSKEQAKDLAKAQPKDQPKGQATDQVREASADPATTASFKDPPNGQAKNQTKDLGTFIEGLSGSVNSGSLSGADRSLTNEAMMNYARRTYRSSPTTTPGPTDK